MKKFWNMKMLFMYQSLLAHLELFWKPFQRIWKNWKFRKKKKKKENYPEISWNPEKSCAETCSCEETCCHLISIERLQIKDWCENLIYAKDELNKNVTKKKTKTKQKNWVETAIHGIKINHLNKLFEEKYLFTSFKLLLQ